MIDVWRESLLSWTPLVTTLTWKINLDLFQEIRSDQIWDYSGITYVDIEYSKYYVKKEIKANLL